MIIDPSYFIGEINLPQTGNTEGTQLVQQAIDTNEPKYLQHILDYELWQAFTDGISGSGVVAQRWTDLLQGKTFTRNGRTFKWPGFQAKPSPISQYVYYRFLNKQAQTTTLVGQATAKTDNATRVNPVPDMIAAWNQMVELNFLLAGFLNANCTTYPEWHDNGIHWGLGAWSGCDLSELYKYKNCLDI